MGKNKIFVLELLDIDEVACFDEGVLACLDNGIDIVTNEGTKLGLSCGRVIGTTLGDMSQFSAHNHGGIKNFHPRFTQEYIPRGFYGENIHQDHSYYYYPIMPTHPHQSIPPHLYPIIPTQFVFAHIAILLLRMHLM